MIRSLIKHPTMIIHLPGFRFVNESIRGGLEKNNSMISIIGLANSCFSHTEIAVGSSLVVVLGAGSGKDVDGVMELGWEAFWLG